MYFCPLSTCLRMLKTMLWWPFLVLVLFASPRLVAQKKFEFPEAVPGRCYVQCLVPDRYELVSENIVLRPEHDEQMAMPPRFETRADSYVVRQAYVRLSPIGPEWDEEEVRLLISPAGRQATPSAYMAVQDTFWIRPPVRVYSVTEPVWETVQEAVEVEPAHQKVEVLPVKYRWEPQPVMVRPPSRRWIRKKPDKGCLDADPDNCAVWCLIETPAQYQTIYRQEPVGCDSEDPDDCVRYFMVPAKTVLKPVERVKEPARALERTEPGAFQLITRWQLRPGESEPPAPPGVQDEYLTLRRRVLRREAYVKADTVPAVYAPIQRKVLISHGMLEERRMPAEYATVLKRKLVAPGGYWVWREVFCEEKIAQLNIRQIQEALKVRGYYKGRIDGVLNEQTRAAISQFQLENDLPADGNLDIETLLALGISG